jgi:hypothetical protein
MAKNEEDSCRHGYQCIGCKLWYCSDDEMFECINYCDNNLCYNCGGISNPKDFYYFCHKKMNKKIGKNVLIVINIEI